jgi:hypothetical protein
MKIERAKSRQRKCASPKNQAERGDHENIRISGNERLAITQPPERLRLVDGQATTQRLNFDR